MLTADIARAIGVLAGAGDRPQRLVLRPYLGPQPAGDPEVNQFLLLLKPHALDVASGVDVARVLKTVQSVLTAWKVEVGGAVAVSSRYMVEHSLIQRTYETLNRAARLGPRALSQSAAARLGEVAAQIDAPSPRVLGGFAFLREQQDLTELGLCLLANNLPTQKLGAGAYATILDCFGERVVVMNAFHPHQLATLTRPGTVAVALECWSRRSFHDLREQMVGGIFPDQAAQGSLRRTLFEDTARTGVRGASPQLNYVHISPGPLEAALHMSTYFSDHGEAGQALPVTATNLGAVLHSAGVSAAEVEILTRNPEVVVDGRAVPAFDLSEDLDTSDLAAILGNVRVAPEPVEEGP